MSENKFLLQFLRYFKQEDVEKIRDEFCEYRGNSNDNKKPFTRAVKKGLSLRLENGKITYEEIFDFVGKNNLLDSKDNTKTKINELFADLELSGTGFNSKKVRENVYQAEIYQALKFKLENSNYNVEREYHPRGKKKKVDIGIADESAPRFYLIEVKKNSDLNERAYNQIKNYRTLHPEVKKVYVCHIIDNTTYELEEDSKYSKHKKVRKYQKRLDGLKNVDLRIKTEADLLFDMT